MKMNVVFTGLTVEEAIDLMAKLGPSNHAVEVEEVEEAAEEVKPKRRSKSKKEEPVEEVEETDELEDYDEFGDDEDDVAPASISQDQIMEAAKTYIRKQDDKKKARAKVKKLIKKHGADSIANLDHDEYEAVLKALTK